TGHQGRAKPFGTAALDVVLQVHTLVAVELMAAFKRLPNSFGALAAAPASVQREGIVVRRNALVGTGDVAARWIDHMRQCLEGDIALPAVGRLVGIAVATHHSPTDRHASSALEADSSRGVGVDEVEHGDSPILQCCSKARPITRAADGNQRAHVVEGFLAYP